MRFQVPQFIEFEDKIFGPLTLKQFIYIAGSAGIIVVFFSLTPKLVAFFLSIPVAILGGALAFYKVNNKPFIEMIEAFFKYSMNKKLYIWKKEEKVPEQTTEVPKQQPQLAVPKLSQSKLKDLTWSLDVKDTSARE